MVRSFIKNFEEFEGLDITSSDLSRNENFASIFQNWEHVGLKSIRGRRGNKQFAFHAKGGSGTIDQSLHGIASYKYLSQNETTVKLAEKLLLFYGTKTILTLTTGTVTITYTGVSAPGKMSILLDTASSTYKAYFYANAILVHTLDLGNGDSSSLSLSSFISTVNGYSDFNCVLTSPTTFPALGASTTEPYALEAFEMMKDLPIATGGGTAITINYFDSRNALLDKFPSGSGYDNYTFTNGQGQAVSTLNKNNVLYIAFGRRLAKWDGMNFYDAGLPKPAVNAIANTAGAGLSAGTYKYRIRFHFRDFQQNDIYGDYVETSVVVAGGGSSQVTITIDPSAIVNAGFNTKFARVNGAQAGVTTITVDAGHTFEIGDPIYFSDSATLTYLERYVTATTATTITITGAVVTVGDNTPMSCNLRFQLGRTTANGVDVYELSYSPTLIEPTYEPTNFTFVDGTSDAILTSNALMDFPTSGIPIEEAPFSTTLCEHQGKIFAVSGVSPFTGVSPSLDVYYEFDPDFIEAFSSLATVRIPSTTKSAITCLHSSSENMLAVFKETSYFNIVGEIGLDGNYQVITISDGDIGCPSPHSIQKINALNGSLFLSNRGFALLTNGIIDETIGERTRLAFQDIEYFRGSGDPAELISIAPNQDKIIPYKAMSVNHNIDGKYICYVPAYNGFWGDLVSEWTTSRCFVFDYRYNKWGEYNKYFRGNGGYAMYGDKLHSLGVFTAYDYPASVAVAGLYRETKREVNNYNGTAYVAQFQYDYADGTFPIENIYKTTGLHLGTPSKLKQFLGCKIYQLATAITAFSLRLKTYRNFGTTIHSDVTFDFATTTQEKDKDLRVTSSRVLAFEFSNVTIHQCPMMSGYEIDVEEDYVEETLQNR